MGRKSLYRDALQTQLDFLEHSDQDKKILVVITKDKATLDYVNTHGLIRKYAHSAMSTKKALTLMDGLIMVNLEFLKDKSFFEKVVSECSRINPENASLVTYEMVKRF